MDRDLSNLCVFLSSDAQFVRVAPLSETDNPEDDKVYMFFTERAQEAEGAAGKVLYSRVARVCKVRSKFLREKKTETAFFRIVCSCSVIGKVSTSM